MGIETDPISTSGVIIFIAGAIIVRNIAILSEKSAAARRELITVLPRPTSFLWSDKSGKNLNVIDNTIVSESEKGEKDSSG